MLSRVPIRICACGLAGVVAVGSSVPALGAPTVGAVDKSVGYTMQILTNVADCSTGVARFRAKGTLTYILGAKKKDKYYFDKTIKFKEMIGTDRYLELDSRSYDSPRFKASDLPTYTTLADRMQKPTFDRVYVFFTTTLRKVRRGPDKKVWKDERRLRVKTQNCDPNGWNPNNFEA